MRADDTAAELAPLNKRRRTQLSRFLSFVLRHEPEAIGLELDRKGWVEIDVLLQQCGAHGKPMTRTQLEELVETSPKQRFAISADGDRIRANQGHSIEVDLGYAEATPPDLLFHGTVDRFLESIRRHGLEKRSRHHVHLSPDVETATAVGGRRGRPVVLRIHAARMQQDGYVFYLSENGVWLTEAVPPDYIEFPEKD